MADNTSYTSLQWETAARKTKAVRHRGIASRHGISLLLWNSSSRTCFQFWAYHRDLDTLERRSWQSSKDFQGQMEWLSWVCLGCAGGYPIFQPRGRGQSGMELQEAVLASWMLAWERVCASAVCDSAGGRGTARGPSLGIEVLVLPERAYRLCYSVCKALFLPRWMFFHCSFPLIKRVFSGFAACIHLISVLKSVMGDFLPKAHYLRVKIPLRNLVPSNTSSLKFKQ